MAQAQAGGKNLAMRQVRIINHPSTRETELDARAVHVIVYLNRKGQGGLEEWYSHSRVRAFCCFVTAGSG